MPHEDGAAYYPVVATVSLGAPIILDVYEKKKYDEEPQGQQSRQVDMEIGTATSATTMAQQYRILQEKRSLLVTTGKLYTEFLHGIAERETDEDLGAESVCNWELLGNKEVFDAGGYARQTRISLTYRDVLKVSKLGNSIKLGKR
jgi:alkylated DNA repair protein alkB family protein 6